MLKLNNQVAVAVLFAMAFPLAAQKAKPPATPVTAPLAAKEEIKPEAKPQVAAEFKMFGALGVVYSEDTYGLTCLGPKFGFSYGSFSIAVGLFPSLVYSKVIYGTSNSDALVRPNLGAGAEIGWGKLSIITPVYYMPNNQYRYTIGLAYKF